MSGFSITATAIRRHIGTLALTATAIVWGYFSYLKSKWICCPPSPIPALASA